MVKLGTDRGFRRGAEGGSKDLVLFPLPQFHIRHLPIPKTFETSPDVSEICFGRRIIFENFKALHQGL